MRATGRDIAVARVAILMATTVGAWACSGGNRSAGRRVEITADSSVAKGPITGRLFVFFSPDTTREPRLEAGSYAGSIPFFGADVSEWRSDTAAALDTRTLGFPYSSLDQLAAGDYYVEAMLEPYTRFSRADGHVIWAHNDQWEG